MHSYSYISEIIIEITAIYLLSGPLCINEYLIGCLYERAHFPNYNGWFSEALGFGHPSGALEDGARG